jgi:aspartate kinase
MKVLKFGGTSVGSASAIKLVAKRCLSEKSPKVVVLSANAGITDMLVAINNHLPKDYGEALKVYEQISDRLNSIAEGLDLSEGAVAELRAMLDRLQHLMSGVEKLNFLSPNVANRILAFGELCSTNIFFHYYAQFANAHLLEVSDHLHYNFKAETYSLSGQGEINELLDKGETVITQGFICSDENGNISNLGRGGSDYSASIIAAEMGAAELQIWTDVNGILSADPRIIAKPVTKKSINISNLSRMAFFGAKVIHPSTLKPTSVLGIPVRVLNTFEEENAGTLVTNGGDSAIPTFTIKRNCYQYMFQFGKKRNLYLINKYVSNRIAKHNLNLLFCSQLENSLQYVFEQEVDLMMDSDMPFSRNEVDIIYICELDNSKINVILKNINYLKIEQTEIDWQNGSILILATTGNSIEQYNRFHDLLIEGE